MRLSGVDGLIAQRPDGHFAVLLSALRPRRTTLVLTGTHAGRRATSKRLTIARGGRLGPPAREPQSDPATGFGAPGASDATGGRIDIGIQAFRIEPSAPHARPGQRVAWHNLDHADHLIRFDGAAGGTMRQGRIGYDERGSVLVTRTGILRYRCALHPWVRGQLRVSAR